MSLLSERTMSVESVVSDTKGPREEAWRRGVRFSNGHKDFRRLREERTRGGSKLKHRVWSGTHRPVLYVAHVAYVAYVATRRERREDWDEKIGREVAQEGIGVQQYDAGDRRAC